MKLVTTKEAIKILDCSLGSLKNYIRKGKLYPCKRVGGKNFYNEDSIRKFKTLRQPSNSFQSLNESSKSWKRFYGTKTLITEDMDDVVDKWKTSTHDTGSADVHIGIYTENILQLERDMKSTQYDDPAFRKMRKLLVKYVLERRRLLIYLQTTNYQRYRKAVALIEKMG